MKRENDVCAKCGYNMLCATSRDIASPFYCTGCGVYSCVIDIYAVHDAITCGRVRVPSGCMHIQKYLLKTGNEVDQRSRFEVFVQSRRQACAEEAEMKSTHVERLTQLAQTLFYYGELRTYMCEECTLASIRSLNAGLERIRKDKS